MVLYVDFLLLISLYIFWYWPYFLVFFFGFPQKFSLNKIDF